MAFSDLQRHTSTLLVACLFIAITACGEVARLPISAGTGIKPTLPPSRQTLIPTVNIAPAKPWPAGTLPTAAALSRSPVVSTIRVAGTLIFVPFENGKAAGAPIDVLTGFLSDEGNALGRPVGVALDQKGALLVADDVGNVIWRVSAAR